jgi:ubiquinone/menaquinone biosynthesis C-methylase UbiE
MIPAGEGPDPPADVVAYYARFPEESRLSRGASRLEFERTREILARALPEPPARVVDVGGAAGAYSIWLAERGYEVHLIDASARLVEEARRRSASLRAPIASLEVADARALPRADASADAVLLLGPLYHLTGASDRALALREAHRVLTVPGVLVAAGISRYASALDGLARKLSLDPRFVAIRDRDLRDGQHRNPTGNEDYFTTAYFHRPEELEAEVAAAGFDEAATMGVEGPGWMVPDFDARWEREAERKDLMDVARALESEPSIRGASAHLLCVARKR